MPNIFVHYFFLAFYDFTWLCLVYVKSGGLGAAKQVGAGAARSRALFDPEVNSGQAFLSRFQCRFYIGKKKTLMFCLC